MVTVCGQVVALPLTSVTFHVTVVVPTGLLVLALPVPVKSLLATPRTPQLSPTPVGNGTVTEALHTPKSATLVMFTGQVIVGNWLSVTFTVKLHGVAQFPATSFAVTLTV